MNTNKNLYALLIGINNYLSPSIPNLGGTHKDLGDVHDHIVSHYPQFTQHIRILKDEDASRANIVHSFEEHLGQAQEGDVVLFYYSGHGSWEKTHPAFLKFDPDGQSEVLICYDSRTNNQFDLADKELAVLLNYVARNNAEVVMLVDSCHSGSISRFADDKVRMTGSANKQRELKDYLYDATVATNQCYYQQLAENNGGDLPAIPMSRHITFSACSEQELARETRKGGWFTQSLLEVLRNSTGLSYFQVYSQIFSIIAQKPAKQTPQLEANGLFNANNVFLTGQKSNTAVSRFRIGFSQTTRQFKIEFGAQVGFPLNIERPINFNIYTTPTGGQNVGVGQVRSIGLVDSDIRISFQQASNETVFWGELLDYALAPIHICFEGADEDLTILHQALKQRPLQQVLFVNNDAVCPFVLAWDSKDACYRLTERQQEAVWNAQLECYESSFFNRPVFILEFGKEDLNDPFKMTTVIETLEHLSQWKYTAELDNPKTRINKKDIVLTFGLDNPADAQQAQCLVYEGKGTTKYNLVEANEVPQKDYHQVLMNYSDEQALQYSVRIQNVSREKYYLGLALISANYGVIPLQSNIILEPGQVLEEAIDSYYCSLSMDNKGDIHTTNYIKVFISKTEINTLQGLEMPELSMETQLQDFQLLGLKGFGPKTSLNDWCVKTIALQLKKDIKAIGSNKLELDARGIIIHKHPALQAKVRFNSPERNTRAANQLFDNLASQSPDMQLFFMDDGTGFPSETVLELSNIENEASLADQPLQISVPKVEGEIVFPFTVETVLSIQEDGSYTEELLVWPIGVPTGVDEQGNNLYEIKSLPSHSNKGTRSLGKILKMSFGKIIMGQDGYALSWVDYTQGGHRDNEGVKEKVEEATTILIALHSMMGDTSMMAQNLAFAQAHYDLILTFDYESLNTSIHDTANNFKSSLTAVGIHEGNNKQVDVVALGMGGLVARAFVESPKLRGDQLLRNLYMLGTPNAGSAFSKIAHYRDLLVTGLTFALNFQAPGIGTIAKLLTGLSISKNLTITLEQMNEGSAFLQELNNHTKPDKVQYYILAGSTKNYHSKASKRLAKLTEWAAIKTGQLIYGNKENDMVVATSSIVGVPEYFNAITVQIDCHYMVYFVDQQSIAILEGWMQDNRPSSNPTLAK